MKYLYSVVGACAGHGALAACGGSNRFSSSTLASVTPQTASQVAYGRYGSHRVGKNAQIESVLHSFGGSGDGANPYAGLIDVGGTLYGTTLSGGAHFVGTVYNITTSGEETVVYSFAGSPDGDSPESGLTKVGDTLYGTTRYGGAGGCRLGCGSVFKITTSSAYSLLYSFTGSPDGAKPSAGLTDVGGTLYGTTHRGGANDKGTVFKQIVDLAGCRKAPVYSFAGEPRRRTSRMPA